MPDREKVILGLEVCTDSRINCHECPYFKPVEMLLCSYPMMKDALALLREQEPVEPWSAAWSYLCGKCKKPLRERGFAYCPWCGRRIKWQD